MVNAPLIDPLQRLRNEVHVWTLLHDRGANVVPLVGVYSNEAHPFSLVYEYMYGCDLKQYLRNNPNVGGLKLVLIPSIHFPSLELLPYLTTVGWNSPRLEPHARP